MFFIIVKLSLSPKTFSNLLNSSFFAYKIKTKAFSYTNKHSLSEFFFLSNQRDS